MIGIILFWLFLLSAVIIIFTVGKKVDQQFSMLLVTAVAATFSLNRFLGWDDAQIYITVIDSLLLILSLSFLSVTKAYWPIWFSAFQAIVVATSIAQLVFPNNVPAVYTNMQGFWFFPAVTSMVIGVMLDNRANSKTV
jgi:hypothetical protein